MSSKNLTIRNGGKVVGISIPMYLYNTFCAKIMVQGGGQHGTDTQGVVKKANSLISEFYRKESAECDKVTSSDVQHWIMLQICDRKIAENISDWYELKNRDDQKP